LLAYFGASGTELLSKVAVREIEAKRQKDGKPMFGISAPWSFDDCFLRASGGLCLYYQAHNGPQISCIEQLHHPPPTHPNCIAAPTQAEIMAFEQAVAERLTLP
jgi:hypothetical protein